MPRYDAQGPVFGAARSSAPPQTRHQLQYALKRTPRDCNAHQLRSCCLKPPWQHHAASAPTDSANTCMWPRLGTPRATMRRLAAPPPTRYGKATAHLGGGHGAGGGLPSPAGVTHAAGAPADSANPSVHCAAPCPPARHNAAPVAAPTPTKASQLCFLPGSRPGCCWSG